MCLSKHARRTCWSAASVSPSKMPSAHGSESGRSTRCRSDGMRGDAQTGPGPWSRRTQLRRAIESPPSPTTHGMTRSQPSTMRPCGCWSKPLRRNRRHRHYHRHRRQTSMMVPGRTARPGVQRHQSAQQRAHQFHRIPARNPSRQGPGISRILPLERRNAGSLRRRRVTLLAAPRVAAQIRRQVLLIRTQSPATRPNPIHSRLTTDQQAGSQPIAPRIGKNFSSGHPKTRSNAQGRCALGTAATGDVSVRRRTRQRSRSPLALLSARAKASIWSTTVPPSAAEDTRRPRSSLVDEPVKP